MQIAGIDQGTTSTRALLLDNNGELQIIHAVEHQQSYPREGWVEHNPEELIRNIQACANALVSVAGHIDAIGMDNQGESCLAWDAQTKEALSPVIVWQDSRSIAMLEKLRSDGLEKQTRERAGLPLDPYFSASKLAWIVQNLPAAKSALAQGRLRLGTTDAYFLDRLAGRFVTDVSTASRTSLMNLAQLNWDESLCQSFGVPVECLPEIVATTGDFGSLQTERGGVALTASVVDQQAALYGFGCRRPGDAKITFGTGAFALMLSGKQIINRPELGLIPTVAWQLRDHAPVYAVDGGVFTASAALNWAQSLGLFNDFASINSFSTAAAIHSGLAFVPALAGLGSPHWEPRARGSWAGLALEHTPQMLVQSILEGVAFRACELVEAMDSCMALSPSILIDGGMSKNAYFVQFLANITQREIRAAKIPELTGLGTVQLAGDALGYQPVAASRFGSCKAKSDDSATLEKFRQAIELSKAWARS